jgi:hypothetical protein
VRHPRNWKGCSVGGSVSMISRQITDLDIQLLAHGDFDAADAIADAVESAKSLTEILKAGRTRVQSVILAIHGQAPEIPSQQECEGAET